MADVTDSTEALADALAANGAGFAVADSATTYVGLRWLGTIEGSPAVATMIERLGLAPGLILRTVVAVALVAVVWKLVTVPALRVVALSAVGGLYVWVVGWNLHVMYG